MITYQDYLKNTEGKTEEVVTSYLRKCINEHRASDAVKIADIADAYDAQQNTTIMQFTKYLYSGNGRIVEDTLASNNRLASNYFHRLNVQRNTYLLGNGINFTKTATKKRLGDNFDSAVKQAGYNALIHGLTFVFWNHDRLYNFKLSEFVPLWDEETSALRAGIRYWQIDPFKPLTVVLYEEDGYTKFREQNDEGKKLEMIQPKRSYVQRVQHTEIDGDEIVDEFNYSFLPIIPFWGCSTHQSTLVGMRPNIDAYDLIKSGFANDVNDCAEIYWLINGAAGMDDIDLQQFRERLKMTHIANTDRDGQVVPYTQEIPYSARSELLTKIRSDLYEDFGGLDVHTIAAGATNDHIDAAYQAMDEEADDYEKQCTDAIKQILALVGVEDEPVYKRNRISNQMEQVQMVMMEAPYLDEETVLSKLPNITVDEIREIQRRKGAEEMNRFIQRGTSTEDEEDTAGEETAQETAVNG